MEEKQPGQTAYEGYFQACGGKSLISGAALPDWYKQDAGIRAAWAAAENAVRESMGR